MITKTQVRPQAQGSVAALFPGQGSQAVGMAKSFYRASPAAKAVLDEAEEAMPGLLELMWEGPEDLLQLTSNQQPALVAAGAAAFAAYRDEGGVMPRYAAGHSLGEFTAYVAAGSLTVAQAVKLVRRRGLYMQEAVPPGVGAMAAVMKLSPERVAGVCADVFGVVELANLNSPGQTVISGEREAVAAAAERLKEAGAKVIALKVSAPFHCSLMAPAARRLARDLAATPFAELRLGILSNVSAEPVARVEDARGLLEQQVTKPVRWRETLERLHALGVTRFIEFGSGRVLTGLVARTLPDARAQAVVDMKTLGDAL